VRFRDRIHKLFQVRLGNMDVTHFLDEEFSELYHYIGIDVPNAVATTATTNQGTPERLFSFFCRIYLDAEGP
jgi:hypothetical protein